MKIISNEIKINFFKSKYLSVIFILHLALIFTLIGVLSMNIFTHSSSYTDFYNIFKDNQVSNIVDVGGTEIYSEKMNLDNIENISGLYHDLDSNYTRIGQIVSQLNSKFDSSKVEFMDIDSNRINSYEGLGTVPYKSLRVNNNFFDLYQIEIADGKGFPVDYTYKLGETIPVLLGNAYKEHYQVGDTFLGDYFLFPKDSTFKIIGFLEDDATYFNLNLGAYGSLENYILVPDVEINEDNSYRNEVIIANYAQRIPSVYLSNTDNSDDIKQVVKQYDLSSMYRVDNQKYVVDKIYQDSKNLTSTMLLAFIALSLFSLVIITMNCFRKISMNFERYAIHLANGASKKDITKLILCDLIIILVISDLLGIGINGFFIIKNATITSIQFKFIWPVALIIVIFSILIYLIIYLIVKLKLRKFKTVDFIRRLQP